MSDDYGSAEGRRGGFCCWCCNFIFTAGLTALFLWLSLRGSDPTCSIQDFYVPALNRTDNSTTARSNHSLYFDLKLDNKMKDKGVRYDDVNLSFFYGPNTSLSIANYTVPGFYQGRGKNTHRRRLVDALGVPWESAYTAVSNGTIFFRVGLATRISYKILYWFTKRHSFTVGAIVEVNESGKKVNHKGIKLKSSAPAQHGRYSAPVGLLFVLYFLDLLW